MPNYHIRIESEEDGIVGEWDVPGFLFAYDPPDDDDSDLRWITRGLSSVTQLGFVEFIKANLLAESNVSDVGSLLDGL